MSEIEITNHRRLPAQDDSPVSDVEKVLEACQSLSSYQLTRLVHKVNRMLEEPERIAAIKAQIAPGETIEYFESEENRDVEAIFLKHNRTLATVCRTDTGQSWKIDYACIRIGEAEFRQRPLSSELSCDDISVGDYVGFKDRQHRERFGRVIRINQKTVTIDCDDGSSWRVAFTFLFPVIDSSAVGADDGSNDRPKQQLLID